MNWDEILEYRQLIIRIAAKYSNDPDLAEDVAHEVMLKLFEDKRLDTSKFDPNKKKAAVGNTIRNKVLKVLRSRKIGRSQFISLDKMREEGFQFDDADRVFNPDVVDLQEYREQLESSDNNLPIPEDTA